MPFKRRLKDKYAGSSPKNASVVRTLFDLFINTFLHHSDPPLSIRVTFTPTVPHCSLATLIGLCIRVKIRNYFDRQHKLDIFVAKGTHKTEDDVNKQVNDKERVAAAMENENLKKLVERCIGDHDA